MPGTGTCRWWHPAGVWATPRMPPDTAALRSAGTRSGRRFPWRYTRRMPSGTALARHLPANAYRRLRWRNGRGWTREIHAEGRGGADEWDWRLSIAEIEADCPYSLFAGVEREQVLLSGAGLVLSGAAGDEWRLDPPHGRQRFAGDLPIEARLEAGRVEVFNLMWRPDRVAARLWHRPLVGSMLLFVDPGDAWAVHVMAGHARLDDAEGRTLLEMGDTALLCGQGGRARQQLEGAGDLLLVRLGPPASADWGSSAQ